MSATAALSDAFARARTPGATDRRYRVAGRAVRIRYASADLLPLADRALAHLALPGDGPDELTIGLFASATPPLDLPRAGWVDAATSWKPGRTGELVHYDAHGRFTAYDGDRREAYACYRRPDAVTPWERAAPLREVFNAWAASFGGQVVHAAAVGDGERAVLLAGPGGSGKSSTALSCLAHASLEYLGDDLCLVAPHAGGFAAHSLYNSAKLLPPDVARFTALGLAGAGDLVGDGKPTFFLHPRHSARIVAGRPLAAVLLPRVTGVTRSRQAAAADAWRALTPSTLSLLPGDSRKALSFVVDFVRRVPAFWLELGAPRERIPDAILDAFARRAAA